MFENETRGWHGCYSAIGRTSVETFQTVLHKDKILSKNPQKKKIVRGFFTQDDDEPKIINDDHIDIFTLPPTNNVHKKQMEEELKKKITCEAESSKKAIPNEKYKYHIHHHKENLNKIKHDKQTPNYGPSSTKYQPKMDFIWNRIITGPNWDVLSGRNNRKLSGFNYSGIKKSISNNDFSLTHTDFMPKKYFISMDKQTSRGNFILGKDVRIRNEKAFVPKKKRIQTAEFSHKNSLRDENNKNNGFNNFNYTNYNNFGSKGFNIQSKKTIKKGKKIMKKFSDNNKAPDFSKTISREKLNYIQRDRENVRPFFSPNYNYVTPRSLSLVSYQNKIKKKKIQKRNVEPLENDIMYDVNEAFYYINNNKKPKSRDFNLMVSRPNDKSPLPSYMIKKYDREALYNITDKTLRMNNYPNSRFLTDYSSFYPKKSFNRQINLNLLNNDAFLNSKMDDILSKLDTNGNYGKVMEFYTKNLDDVEHEGRMEKFDAITLKHVPKKTPISDKEKNLFRVDLDNNDDY